MFELIPYAVVVTVVTIVVWFVHFRSDVLASLTTIKDNHLTHVEANTTRLVELGEQQLQALARIETKLGA